MKTLIVYATKYGQTEKIALSIANELRAGGNTADAFNSQYLPWDMQLEYYDAVIAGAPVYASGYPTHFKEWVQANSVFLSHKPCAFFSVCLGILEKDNPKTQQAEKKVVEDFFKTTDWHPETWDIFPGALAYTKYNWLMRLVMKKISRKAGRDTDTSIDYEYTDWPAVRRFTKKFTDSLHFGGISTAS